MNVPDPSVEFEHVLEYLKLSRGFDFTSYKRTSLRRRIEKRMAAVNCETFGAYLDHLEVHQDEFQDLFNTILINVTSFFRDPDAWTYVATEIIPRLLLNKAPDDPVRVWTAGCASGEESYTIAILFAEAMGAEEARNRLKVYATDVDDDALNQSRQATYRAKDVENVPPHLLAKYFERDGDGYSLDRELRRLVIFGRHDLLQDAPISRVDLLLCRNTMMYFNSEAQERILTRFHFALNETGFLFLGKAETLLTHGQIFTPVNLPNRVFAKVPGGRNRLRGPMYVAVPAEPLSYDGHSVARLQAAGFDNSLVAQIVLDTAGLVRLANESARTMFEITPDDIGRFFHDLQVSYRPAEIRSGIEMVIHQRRPVHHRDVPFVGADGQRRVVDIRITPLVSGEGQMLGTSISFQDVTQAKALQDELLNFNQELETAYEEVQSTNEELQTTNEELQSTVEELETTNEELQSTNEELQTMNEELHSSNEEFETAIEDLRQQAGDLNRANAFLESVLAGLRDGVIVVDRELMVLAWNYKSEDLWGLRGDEVTGRHLMNLDLGFPVEKLRQPIRACLGSGGAQELSVEATNRRGRTIDCNVLITPLLGVKDEMRGVIILVEVPQAASQPG